MSKVNEILSLIDQDIFKACTELGKFVQKGDSMFGLFNDFRKELLSQPQGYQKEEFRAKLRLFVDVHKEHIEAVCVDKVKNEKRKFHNQDQVYDFLCHLNFKFHQSHFEAARLGENSLIPLVICADGECGQEWIYNQLIHRFSALHPIHQSIIIDFEKGILTLEDVFDQIAKKLGCYDDISHKLEWKSNDLIDVIREKVEQASQFIVFKNAYRFLHTDNHFDQFYDFLNYLCVKLNRINKSKEKEHQHICVCFFVENHTQKYEHNNKCLVASNNTQLVVQQLTNLKFIILESVQPLSSNELVEWVTRKKEHYETFKSLVDNYDEYLEDFINQCPSKNPLDVIKMICDEIDHNYEVNRGQWLKHL